MLSVCGVADSGVADSGAAVAGPLTEGAADGAVVAPPEQAMTVAARTARPAARLALRVVDTSLLL